MKAARIALALGLVGLVTGGLCGIGSLVGKAGGNVTKLRTELGDEIAVA